jgi:DtxR family Mn-dependent transcriptional regulator
LESLRVEDYVKAIYQICAESDVPTAATGEVARRLGLTPGSVTSMLQRLGEADLVKYQAHRGVRLTRSGEQLALRMLRRHRLVELFLSTTLGLPWDEIHAEAEHIEHAVSDRLIDRIDEFLGHPERDPHGDPIPDSRGNLRAAAGEPLTECDSETHFALERVLDQSPDFLRYLTDGGLAIGETGTVIENLPSAGVITLQAGDRRISLSREMAGKVLVRRIKSPASS